MLVQSDIARVWVHNGTLSSSNDETSDVKQERDSMRWELADAYKVFNRSFQT